MRLFIAVMSFLLAMRAFAFAFSLMQSLEAGRKGSTLRNMTGAAPET